MAFWCMQTNYYQTVIYYLTSNFLDSIDGIAARRFNQCKLTEKPTNTIPHSSNSVQWCWMHSCDQCSLYAARANHNVHCTLKMLICTPPQREGWLRHWFYCTELDEMVSLRFLNNMPGGVLIGIVTRKGNKVA